MAENDDSLNFGDIVIINSSTDENVKGCKGEVIKTDPLTIAVVRVLEFKADQVTKIFDASIGWHKLRETAQGLDIPVTGTRAELELKIKGQLTDPNDEGAIEPNKLKQGDFVKIMDNDHALQGKVVTFIEWKEDGKRMRIRRIVGTCRTSTIDTPSKMRKWKEGPCPLPE